MLDEIFLQTSLKEFSPVYYMTIQMTIQVYFNQMAH